MFTLPNFAQDCLAKVRAYSDKIPETLLDDPNRDTLFKALDNCDIPTIQQKLNAIDRNLDVLGPDHYNLSAAAALTVMHDYASLTETYLKTSAHHALNAALIAIDNEADTKLTISILNICSRIEKNLLQQAYSRTCALQASLASTDMDKTTKDFVTNQIDTVKHLLLLTART